MINAIHVPAPRPNDALTCICPDCRTYAAHPIVAAHRSGDRLANCECGSVFDEGEAVIC